MATTNSIFQADPNRLIDVPSQAVIADAADLVNDAYKAAHGLQGIANALCAVDTEGELQFDDDTRCALAESAARLASVLQRDLERIANMPAAAHG